MAPASARGAGGSGEEIAVVGLACRLPGAPGKEVYWDLLTRGASAIEPVPPGRWTPKNGRIDYGGWVDGIDRFDPGFFRIDKTDAAIMDPQARVILEESLNAIRDAGYDEGDLAGERVGVYIGGRSRFGVDMNAVLRAPNPILGLGQNYLAANISRFFNFSGPSLVVDAACSSGLVGMSLASDALREGRIDAALVGAVSLLLDPAAHDMFAARGILSENGEFHIFDKRSGGEVLGEGAGVVLLKRLGDAVREGSRIDGVVKAISVNNDGRTIGPGSPDPAAQKQVIREALARSGASVEEIGYIEVNGGGSPVVDAIEIQALSDAYRLDDPALSPCFVGSIKPNTGHLLLTSGMAAFIRCLLSLGHKRIPPFLSALQPFEHYDFSTSRARFNRETVPWTPPPGKKRVAALNSFPDGGTNCHLIMEEFTPTNGYRQTRFPKPVAPMAKTCFPLPLPSTTPSTSISGSNSISGISSFGAGGANHHVGLEEHRGCKVDGVDEVDEVDKAANAPRAIRTVTPRTASGPSDHQPAPEEHYNMTRAEASVGEHSTASAPHHSPSTPSTPAPPDKGVAAGMHQLITRFKKTPDRPGPAPSPRLRSVWGEIHEKTS